MRSLMPTKWLPLAGLLYLLAPLAGSISFSSVTSSWVPLVSLTGRLVPSCPVLVPTGGALVPGAVVAVALAPLVRGAPLAAGMPLTAGAPWLAGVAWLAGAPGLCGGDAEHAATRRTAAVRPVAAPIAPAVFLLRVQAMWLIGGLRPGVPGWDGAARRAAPPGAARPWPCPLPARAVPRRVRVLAARPRPGLAGWRRVAGRGGWHMAGLGRWPRPARGLGRGAGPRGGHRLRRRGGAAPRRPSAGVPRSSGRTGRAARARAAVSWCRPVVPRPTGPRRTALRWGRR